MYSLIQKIMFICALINFIPLFTYANNCTSDGTIYYTSKVKLNNGDTIISSPYIMIGDEKIPAKATLGYQINGLCRALGYSGSTQSLAVTSDYESIGKSRMVSFDRSGSIEEIDNDSWSIATKEIVCRD